MNPDDLTAGLTVAVRDWYSNQGSSAPDYASPFGMVFGTSGGGSKRRDYMGTPLLVAAVSLPYVACRVAFVNKVVVLDVRECELTRVSPEYVAIMRAKHEAEARKPKANKMTLHGLFGTHEYSLGDDS